jgi:hypothetical protein
MRLNGWQKLGVALSIVWAVAAGIHTHGEDVERAENFANLAYKTCSNTKMLAKSADLSRCEKEKATNTETWMKDSDKNVAFAALAPIPVGWLAGFILLYLGRIQLAGFRAAVPWSELTRPKKGFAIFCCATLVAGLLFASMIIMNLYVDTQVPVALSPFMEVIKTGDDMVRASGTWTRHGATAGSAMAFPLQTSTIDCYRSENRCVEARASVSGNLLTSEVLQHDVQSWTNASIVLKDTYLCAEEVYTIDLNTKTVSGAGRHINSDTPFCKLSPAGTGEAEWGYRMENGSPVYWDIRSKARPRPLRVIQSMFGH